MKTLFFGSLRTAQGRAIFFDGCKPVCEQTENRIFQFATLKKPGMAFSTDWQTGRGRPGAAARLAGWTLRPDKALREFRQQTIGGLLHHIEHAFEARGPAIVGVRHIAARQSRREIEK